jgi:heme exporter protein B
VPDAVVPSAGRPAPPGWARQALLLAKKDLAVELSTGEVVVQSAFFAVLVVVLASMAFHAGPETARSVAPGAIWLAIAFAAVLGLGRSWQREREERALQGLLVLPIAPSALFAGKALGLCAFLGVVEAVVIPLGALLLNVDLVASGGGIAAVALAATPGVAAAGTLFGAMTVGTRARDLLLAVVLFPLLAPTLLVAVVATRELIGGASVAELADFFVLMAGFDLLAAAGGLGLFGTLLEG